MAATRCDTHERGTNGSVPHARSGNTIRVVPYILDPDATNIVALLDGITGAWEDAQEGWRQAQAGDTIPLGQL
jgi:hypothetical protein